MKKKLLLLVTVVVMSIACTLGFAACNQTGGNSGDNGGNHSNDFVDEAGTSGLMYYSLRDGTYAVGIGAAQNLDSIVIGSTHDGKRVTAIHSYGFQGGDLKTIKIPNSVTSIGVYAFTGSDLEEFTWPSSVAKIDVGVFAGCGKLKKISIPSSVYSIGSGAFRNCRSLREISISSNVSSIGSGAFEGCSIEKVNITDFSAWCKINFSNQSPTASPLTQGSNLYLNGTLLPFENEKLTIPSDLKYVRAGAFRMFSFREIIIPKTVKSIEKGAFSGCDKLESITLPFIGNDAQNDDKMDVVGTMDPVDGFGYIFDGHIPQTLKTVTLTGDTIPCRALNGCSMLTTVILSESESVIKIGRSAFGNCRGLTSVTMPDNVIFIGEDAFSGCTSLTSITIPDGVTSIGKSTFNGCTSLTSITIPDGVTSIGDYTFSGCTSLTSINFTGTKAEWKAIKKGTGWAYDTGDYTIYCTDGIYKYI